MNGTSTSFLQALGPNMHPTKTFQRSSGRTLRAMSSSSLELPKLAVACLDSLGQIITYYVVPYRRLESLKECRASTAKRKTRVTCVVQTHVGVNARLTFNSQARISSRV